MREARQESKWISTAVEAGDFPAYQQGIMHDWLRTLTVLATTLVPFFFVLDLIMSPPSLYLRFGIYRAISTALALVQFFVVRRTRPGRWSILHASFISLQVGGIVALMTSDLGGFASSYYAGLNLVIIGVNLLMPWRGYHTGVNALLILGMYLAFNLASGRAVPSVSLWNNLFFLCATGIIAASISEVRFRLIRKEFSLLVQVRAARDALELSRRSLKGLLDLSGQGFLSFDRDLRILPDYSRECRVLFGGEIAGRPLDELLYADARARRDFADGLALYFRGSARAEVIFDLLDPRLHINRRTVRIEYKAVDEGHVMAVLTDMTEEVLRQERDREENEKKSMLLKVIGSRLAFGALQRDARRLFSSLNGGPLDAPLARTLHTFKGDAGFLEFRKTQAAAHELEDAMVTARALGGPVVPSEKAAALASAYQEEVSVISGMLGRAWVDRADSVEIPRADFQWIESHVRSEYPGDRALQAALAEHGRLPLRELFARYPQMVAELASRKGKRLQPLAVSGGEGVAAPKGLEEVVGSFGHILRNMVDHGIEHPGEREAKGKPAEGRLKIDIADEDHELVFTLADDGRGVPLEEVEKKARALGLVAPDSTPTAEELLALIFRDNFSTASSVTTVSGRGVGLSAVRDAVRRRGGSISVRSSRDAGTIFTISLPKNGRNGEAA